MAPRQGKVRGVQRVPTGKPARRWEKSGRDEDVENAFPTSSTAANVGSNGLVRKPQVRKQHKQHEMLSGFESQRASGCTGVVDLLLLQDDDHVVVGTGFAQVLVVELPDGQGKKPKAEFHAAGHHNSVQGIAMHNKAKYLRYGRVGLFIDTVGRDQADSAAGQDPARGAAVAIRGPRKRLHHHHHSHAPLEEHVAVGYNDGEVEIFAFPSRQAVFPGKKVRRRGDLLRQVLAQWSRPSHRVARQRHLPPGRRGHLSNTKAARPQSLCKKYRLVLRLGLVADLVRGLRDHVLERGRGEKVPRRAR